MSVGIPLLPLTFLTLKYFYLAYLNHHTGAHGSMSTFEEDLGNK